MASNNVNDGRWLDRKFDDGDSKGFPNTMDVISTTGKKITAALTMFAAIFVVLTSATTLFPKLPRRQNDFRDNRGDKRGYDN